MYSQLRKSYLKDLLIDQKMMHLDKNFLVIILVEHLNQFNL